MESASAFFLAKLRHEIDVMAVADALDGGGFVLVDSRRRESWDHGHVPGALHLPTADVERRARQLIPLDRKIVVYSWGPGCNGSTLAALAFANLGYSVQEMMGGMEYWARNGLPVEISGRPMSSAADPLVTAQKHPVDGETASSP
ncbi:rhodanese-like domain-containing protein [Pseudarthrobacter sp. SSS035]|uniref:rhodanese-like domain-containing protein n=1 Tax=Pseudarthrobacter sp. SSS035 TaxID=2931399 RepID=UPI003530C78C